MEQVQADMAEIRNQLTAQMNAHMAQFMEALANVAKGQEELRALVENSRRNDNDVGLFDDISGRVDQNKQEPTVQPRYNPFGDGIFRVNQGPFPPPPPSHLIAGGRKGNFNQNQRQNFGYNDLFSVNNSEPGDLAGEDRRFLLLEERLKAVEGHIVLRMNDMSLVPGVRIPMKFKPPVAMTLPTDAPRQRQQQPRNRNNNQQQQKQPRRFDPVPMTYANLLTHLLNLKLIRLRNVPVYNGRFLNKYNANARCDFHSGGVGHSVENCYAFKCKVQDLLDSQQISFAPYPNTPNMGQNSMPSHDDGSVVNDVMMRSRVESFILKVSLCLVELILVWLKTVCLYRDRIRD